MLYRLTLLSLFCFSAPIFASGNWFAGIGGGATFLNVKRYDYISGGTGWPNDRMHNNNVEPAPLFMVDGGYQWARNNTWFPFYSLALNYTYALASKVSGLVQQYSLPEFTNYEYQYKIKTQTFLAQIKTDLYRWPHLMPFLLAGAGMSLNNASHYTEQARQNVTPRVSPGFRGQTNTAFSYAFGAGLDFIIQKNIWASLMYQYSHLGQAKTGYGVNSSTLTDTNYDTDQLTTPVRSNAVILSVTYLA